MHRPNRLNRKFAFGLDRYGKVLCPSLAADPNGKYGNIVTYDKLLQFKTGKLCGVVTEEDARKAWHMALDMARSKKLKERHIRIARKLGWIV